MIPAERASPGPSPLLLAGPTASGKSELALLLAANLNGEIISVDSMQVYRGMDIGTAKPSAEDRKRVPHHLLDIIELSETFDAARFVQLAHATVAEVQARGRVPILCGGTGWYFQAWLGGLRPAPAADWQLRAELERTPLPELLRQLAEADPAAFAEIDRRNPRRVIRAIEVIRLTGRKFSETRVERVTPAPDPIPFFVLRRDRADLAQRIERRVDKMFEAGLVEETRKLLTQGLGENLTASQALGYKQVLAHLQGERSLPETIELVKARTRQYARRQFTWFKRLAGVSWISLPAEEKIEAVADQIAAQFRLLPKPGVTGQ